MDSETQSHLWNFTDNSSSTSLSEATTEDYYSSDETCEIMNTFITPYSWKTRRPWTQEAFYTLDSVEGRRAEDAGRTEAKRRDTLMMSNPFDTSDRRLAFMQMDPVPAVPANVYAAAVPTRYVTMADMAP